MTSSAPMGSYTPGPKTYGRVASRRRSRRLGSSLRDAGTLNPSGRRGVATSSIGWTPFQLFDLARLGRAATRSRDRSCTAPGIRTHEWKGPSPRSPAIDRDYPWTTTYQVHLYKSN